MENHQIPRMKKTLKRLYERLVKLLPNVVTFNSDSPEVPFVQGEASIGMLWNGSAYLAHKENPSIQFVYPKKARFSGWITTRFQKVRKIQRALINLSTSYFVLKMRN